MANVKASVKAEKPSTGTKLLPAKQIKDLIDQGLRNTRIGLEQIQMSAVQCMLHAEKHKDITLAERLINGIRTECPGVVVAGFNAWFEQHSPIRFKMVEDSDTGEKVAKATLLKEGDEGYKAFNVAEAEEKPAMKTRDVLGRTNRPIVKPTIEYLKKRIKGLIKQVNDYQERTDVPSDQKMSETEVERAKIWCRSVSEFADRVSILDEVKKEKTIEKKIQAKTPTSNRRKNTRNTDEAGEENLKSQTKVA